MYNPYNPKADNTDKTIDETIRNFKKYLMVQKIASGSIRSYLSDTRFFFNWLEGFLLEKRILNLNETIDDRKWKVGLENRKSKVENNNLSSTFNPQPPSSTFNHLPSLDLLKYVNEAVLNAFKDFLEINNTPVKTINRRFSALRKFGDFSVSQNWLTLNTFDTLRNISPNTPFPESEYHLGEFKANLWKDNSTRATIKNYLNDAKQFIEWNKKFEAQISKH